MDLPVDSAKVTGSEATITLWDAKRLNQQRRGNPMWPYLQQAIDGMGKGSQKAQGLNAVLTSVMKLVENPSHRLYLLCSGKLCLGLIKVGPKKLFIRTKSGQLQEIDPLCVLDFYVHESQQRSGYGRQLYDTVLERESAKPSQLGYDRPSVKFLSFLRKHFSLSDYVPQSNNFVVFTQYFERGGRSGSGGGSSSSLPAMAHHHQNHQQKSDTSSRFGSGGHNQRPEEQQQQQRVLKTSQHSSDRSWPQGMPSAEMNAAASFSGSSFKQRGRSPSPYATNANITPFPDPARQTSSTQAMYGMAGPDYVGRVPQVGMVGGRVPPCNQMPPRSHLLNSAPTLGLSSSCYPGGGSQPRPAGSQQLSRHQLANTHRPGISTQQQSQRVASPTRSGYGFDIITGGGTAMGLGGSVGASAPPAKQAPQSVLDRPMGRKSMR